MLRFIGVLESDPWPWCRVSNAQRANQSTQIRLTEHQNGKEKARPCIGNLLCRLIVIS